MWRHIPSIDQVLDGDVPVQATCSPELRIARRGLRWTVTKGLDPKTRELNLAFEKLRGAQIGFEQRQSCRAASKIGLLNQQVGKLQAEREVLVAAAYSWKGAVEKLETAERSKWGAVELEAPGLSIPPATAFATELPAAGVCCKSTVIPEGHHHCISMAPVELAADEVRETVTMELMA